VSCRRIPAKMLGSYTPLYPHLFSRCHWTTKQTHTTVETEPQSDGISIMTLRRAKFALGVVSPKESISGCWNWVLEDEEPVNM
jgi:hypothetical protein